MRLIVITMTHISLWSSCWSEGIQMFMVKYYAKIEIFSIRGNSQGIMVVEIQRLWRTYLMVRVLDLTPERSRLTIFHSKSDIIWIKSMTNEPWLSSNMAIYMEKLPRSNSNLNSNLVCGNNILWGYNIKITVKWLV